MEKVTYRGINKKRHGLLELLTQQRVDTAFHKKEKYLAISVKDLMVKLNCDRDELHLITCGLIVEDEIILTKKDGDKPDDVTFHASNKGVASYTHGKYITLHKDKIWKRVSNTVLVAGFLLSVLSINDWFKSSSGQETESLEKRIELLEKHQDNQKHHCR